MTAPRKRRPSSTIPVLDCTRRDGSVLYWDLPGNTTIMRDTKSRDVVLLRKQEVTATFSVSEATELSKKLYRDAHHNSDDTQAKYAQALSSAARF